MPLDTASAGMTLILFARQINSFVPHCLLSLIISSSLEALHLLPEAQIAAGRIHHLLAASKRT
jgi:hypothetical protein